MAVPKRRTSRSNTRHRRARWKATAPRLVPITIDGRELLVPQDLVRAHRRGLIGPDGA
ncbi:50S ribosomal protein L32 [Kitasatospora sp. NPDC085464]|uniref:50S ribosomal protein L32 n=1 Tax=Kitasatospora sp. NPDC085464 TaxID=3364063 RepID=UPI0037CAE6D6